MSTIVRAPSLQPGDCIGITASASPVNNSKIARAQRYLEALGFSVKLGKNIYRKQGYLAGTDKERADDINRFFKDKSIKALLGARGGYGSLRILEMLDYDMIKQHPKVLIGFSDYTALQLALWKKVKLISFYGPMAAVDFAGTVNKFTERHFWHMVKGDIGKNKILRKRSNWNVIASGVSRGRLLGGCLSLINPLIGSKYEPDFTNCILLIEEVNEAPYRIDRALQQLALRGILSKINGLILGKFSNCIAEKKPTLTLNEIVHDYRRFINGPIISGADFGHVAAKVTMPQGCRIELDTKQQQIKLLENPVE